MEKSYRDTFLSSILNAIADPIFIIDEEGRYLGVFGGTDRSLYDDGQPLRGRKVSEVLTPEFGDFFVNQITHTLTTNTLNVFDYRLDTQTVNLPVFEGPGGVQWFEARMYPINQLFDGKRAVVAILINITERRALHRRLQELSYLDPLTGLYNRRYFLERLNVYLLEKDSIHIVFCDIDHFKMINDEHGHLAGDDVIRNFALILQSVLGPKVTTCRLGGDEFIAALVDESDEGAKALAEKVRQRTEKHSFIWDGLPLGVTVSIGVANAQGEDLSGTDLIELADKALYKAKEAGRNRVCLHH